MLTRPIITIERSGVTYIVTPISLDDIATLPERDLDRVIEVGSWYALVLHAERAE